MTSAAIVESPAGENQLTYVSALVSNVLRRNSAVEHQTMGTRIHRLIEKANVLQQLSGHAVGQPVPPAIPLPLSPLQDPQ